MKWKLSICTLCLAGGAPIFAQEAGIFDEYREMFGDDNPAELVELQGEDLWLEKRGPMNASLEQCDLGLGAGVTAGAFAQLPRYFKDADKVMDLETRLVQCMVDLQGLETEALVKKPFSETGQNATDIEALATWVAAQSRGIPTAVPQDHPREKAAFETGQALFNYRAGPYDFSCATCHSQSGKRIRLQDLPNLNDPADAKTAFTTWPAYRISQGSVRTMEWRVADCARQQRLPQMIFGSEAAIGLITFMGVQAKGEPMAAPGLKR